MMDFVLEGYKKAKANFTKEKDAIEKAKANEVVVLESIVNELNNSLFNKNTSSIPSILKRAAEDHAKGIYVLPSEYYSAPVAETKTIWVACIFNLLELIKNKGWNKKFPLLFESDEFKLIEVILKRLQFPTGFLKIAREGKLYVWIDKKYMPDSE